METTNKTHVKKKHSFITLQERKQIEKLLKKNQSCSAIAKSLGRSKTGILKEIKKTGKAQYSATKAQKITEENEEIKRKAVSQKLTGKKHNKTNTFEKIEELKTKIENLEFQVEILFDLIKNQNK